MTDGSRWRRWLFGNAWDADGWKALAADPGERRRNVSILVGVVAVAVIVAVILISNSNDESGITATETRTDFGASASNTATVTRSEFGEDWPLTIEEGELACAPHAGGVSVLTLTSGGTTYGLNGIARGSGQYSDIDAIWADQPAGNPATAGLKIDMGPLIDRGLKLCD